TYVTFTDWIFFTATAFIVILFRKSRPDDDRPYRTFGYPITPLIFVVISAWFVVNTLIEQPLLAGAGLAFLGLGYPVYLYFKSKREK
ncbi:MAG: hypothetical protein ACC655_10410, partial [Rhodothermia bacterium]